MGSKYRVRNYRPNELVHLTCRGFNRRPIFLDARDHDKFESIFRRLINHQPPESRPSSLARAQMGNHQHLFAQNGRRGDSITPMMHRLKTMYAQYFNDRYRLAGPVFETPFRGRVVRGGDDIINVVTYIHLNPDNTFRETNSTHPVYTGAIADAFIQQDVVLRAFGGRQGYIDFFNDTARIRAARAAARNRLT